MTFLLDSFMSSSTVLGLGLSCVWIIHSLLISVYFPMTHTTFVSIKGATLSYASLDETLFYTDDEFDHTILTGTI